MTRGRLRIEFEPHASQVQCQFIVESLDAYNMGVTGISSFTPVNFFLRDGRGEVLGGLLALIWGGWLHIRTLWITESLRGGGHGRKLLRAAEELARDHGCIGCYLDTHSFQARPFYEKAGYRVIGTLENVPVGHAKYFLEKRFPRAAGRAGRARRRSAPPGRIAGRIPPVRAKASRGR